MAIGHHDVVLQWPSRWNNVMGILMGHCFGHDQRRHCYGRCQDGTSIGKFCPSADIKNTGVDGKDPNILIDMFRTSKSGSRQAIEVALDCFVVSRSTEDGIKVLPGV